MFRDAAKEVRYHPGRVVATLIAIAISVGFMAAVSIFVDTQSDALGKMMALTTSKADVVATVNSPKQKVTSQQLEAAIKGIPGVQKAELSRPGQTALSTDKANVYASIYPTPSQDFRWAPLADGKYPDQVSEITLAKQLADKLGVGMGQSVEAGGKPLTVVGITDDAPSIFFQTAYVAPALANQQDTWPGGTWLVKTSDPAGASKAIHDALAPLTDQPDAEMYPGSGKNLEVGTAQEAQQQAVKAISGEFDVVKYILWVFSAIAALVGIIIIANTFTILLTQRRRQIGLLRAVGATGGQVRRKFLAEAVLLGLLGSLLGLVFGALVAWGGAHVTGASWFGLKFPWLDLGVQVLIGILLTVLAAVLPSLRATRVAPLEALQPVATSEQRRRGSIVRAVICGLMVAAGAALAVLSINAEVSADTPAWQGPVVLAMAGAGLISLGVLFGAPLFIPTVLKVLGKLFSWAGPTPALAASNAVRNPGRASATATALMLACGLIVTLQVGTATAQRTALDEINQKYPVDVQVSASRSASDPGQSAPGLTAPVVTALGKLPNVKASVTLPGGSVASSGPVSVETLLGHTGGIRAVTDQVPASITDGQILMPKNVKRGTQVVLQRVDAKDRPTGEKITLSAVPSAAIEQNLGMVSPATLAKLVTKPTPQSYWAQLANDDDLGSTMTQLERITTQHHELNAGGSASEAYMITKILDILLKVITGLLGAAVVIALIGVSNTLGLSVIERTRESALLRALGMHKTSLRLMLLVEALLLALAGVLVGVLAGGFFGWLGIRAVLRQADMGSHIQFAVNWPLTLGLIGIAVLAAALASILPGRKAASATPTEALAED
ncbi:MULTISPECIES: FtsX-like permease family protein [unclassified Luteococcus]|uniref:FtsX-like permease family protein n=1 Tax=unclassified Luteococcus TaxID=2639923 RepID=UPI00313EECEA